jgi:competence protein ComEC
MNFPSSLLFIGRLAEECRRAPLCYYPDMRTLLAGLALAGLLSAAKPMELYFIDVEGGQATLIVTPSGQSMLVDAGWPGNNYRDADRIIAACKKAKVKQIDYLLVTHYHRDHVGGVAQLASRFPVKSYITHGPNNETDKGGRDMTESFEEAAKGTPQIAVKPGDKLPLKGVDATVVAADGNQIAAALDGAGAANPLCAAEQRKDADPTENGRSIGFVLKFGDFRFIDLGDLTWNKELDLVCPNNKLGTVDLYLTTHHGVDLSNAKAIVHALHPRVAIMNNGAKKGGSPSAWDIIKSSPGLEDLWQLHFSVAGAQDHNSPEAFLANLDEFCEGKYIQVTAESDGSFSVWNSRNKYSRSYPRK